MTRTPAPKPAARDGTPSHVGLALDLVALEGRVGSIEGKVDILAAEAREFHAEMRKSIGGTTGHPGFDERLRMVERVHQRVGRALWAVVLSLLGAAGAWTWWALAGKGQP